jgi:hypothetical protein
VGLLTRNLVAKLSKAAYDAQTSTKLKWRKRIEILVSF